MSSLNASDTELPPGYKLTELGPLPEEWQVVRLGDTLDRSKRPALLSVADAQHPIPFVPMALLPSDKLYIENWELRSSTEVRSGVQIHDGDLLLAKITPCLENGKQGIVRGLPDGWGYATTEVIPLRPRGVDTEYLAFYLKLPTIRRYLASKMEGATGRQRLPKVVLESLCVPLPPLPEQRAIARVLRAVQRAKEATEQVIAATRELKRALMRHLFTYGPVPVHEVDQVPLKETEIGAVPEGWAVSPLGKVIKTFEYGYTANAIESPDGPKFLRISDIQNYRVDWSS
ncbi:MAG: restriction endonuclease subunit S, partial [Chloroflexi bacterium]|nr:restriction endonuclease subunit S [Chloroflexota bacterium]